MKRTTLRRLASLLLVAALYPGLAFKAAAQPDTTYSIGDIVEFKFDHGGTEWMKGKIGAKCIGGTCGVLKWDLHFDVWQDGWITTSLVNIRRPSADSAAASTSASPPTPTAPAPTLSASPIAPACARPPC